MTDDRLPLLGLLDTVRAQAAAVLHSSAVQQVVVAKLALETAVPAIADPPPLLARVSLALERAAEQARDLMWALEPPSVRPEHLREDLGELLARVAGEGCVVDVAVDGPVDRARLDPVVAALHDLMLDVLAAKTTVTAARLEDDGDRLQATVVDGAGAGPAQVGRQLAATRMAVLGGTVESTADGDVRTTVIRGPA